MKARILNNSNTQQHRPTEEKAKEYPTKRQKGENDESLGWWDEFDEPTKACIRANSPYRT